MIVATIAALAAEAGAAAMPPAGKWTIDYGADCTLSRQFTSPGGPITLGVRPNIMQPGGDLVIVLPGGRSTLRTGSGRIRLGSNGVPHPTRFSRVGVLGKPYHGLTLEPDEAMWTALADTMEITIEVGERTPYRFAVGPMAKALAALSTCQQAQLRFWGADPATMAEPPPGNPWTRWFTPATYPKAAAQRGAKGRSVAMLRIDQQGRVADCHTVRSAGDGALDRAVCTVALSRARFPEVRDGPKARWMPLSVRWWIP